MRILLLTLTTLFIIGCSSQEKQDKETLTAQSQDKTSEQLNSVTIKEEIGVSEIQAKGTHVVYLKCISCHGEHAQRKALNRSKVIAGWSAKKIIKAINGYKDGSYGGDLKAMMKAQVIDLSDSEIKSVANYISKM